MTIAQEHPGLGVGAPHVVVAATYTDPTTGALYVHQDLSERRPGWETESHISPPNVTERLGDVESWVAYVNRYSGEEALLTWNASGLHAVLDYHQAADVPGRCKWKATYAFTWSVEWRAWNRLANGLPLSQKALVEALEDLAQDIREPSTADVLGMLRSLRANVQTTASTELGADGATSVTWAQDRSVAGARTASGGLTLPPEIRISIPVLMGDTTAISVSVRIRVAIDEAAKLSFRLYMIDAERLLNAIYQERVKTAKDLLADGFLILRAAD